MQFPARFLSVTAPCASRGANAPKILSKKDKAGGGKGQSSQKNKKKGEETKKKRKARTTYKQYDMKDAEMFSLCDAMRYVFPMMVLMDSSNEVPGSSGLLKWDKNQPL